MRDLGPSSPTDAGSRRVRHATLRQSSGKAQLAGSPPQRRTCSSRTSSAEDGLVPSPSGQAEKHPFDRRLYLKTKCRLSGREHASCARDSPFPSSERATARLRRRAVQPLREATVAADRQRPSVLGAAALDRCRRPRSGAGGQRRPVAVSCRGSSGTGRPGGEAEGPGGA